ncbi:hypothetical protein FEF09_27510 [Chitinophaga pinensis]|uniref:Uncharacterized protein n=1 Tax=Chitinophaga pinensis TaxID=79329 RepID=A0A5C6LPA2_9BACT|nr:hypothetical protein FEF09_27510 [Chitinophaga pinensis]
MTERATVTGKLTAGVTVAPELIVSLLKEIPLPLILCVVPAIVILEEVLVVVYVPLLTKSPFTVTVTPLWEIVQPLHW